MIAQSNLFWSSNGTLLADRTSAYKDDKPNRLTAVNVNGGTGGHYTYAYNGNGDRLQQVVNQAETTNYTLDLTRGLTQVLDDGTHTYLYGNMRLAQVPTNSPTSYEFFLTDALGSVRQMIDETGTLTLAQAYLPYGERLSSVGSGATSYGFTGEATDASGLIFLRARYYAPGAGRFIAKDPSKLEQNLYLYTGANPINRTDRSGLCTEYPEDPPLTCRVDSGDTLTAIAATYGIESWQLLAQWNPDISNPDSINIGQLIYLSDAQINPEPIPPGPPKESFFSGYIEGTGTTFDILFMRVTAEGREQVYDFANKTRAEFTFRADPVFFGAICGFNTNLLGLGQSWYVGTYNFHYDPAERTAIEQQYGGQALVFSGSFSGPTPLGFSLAGEITSTWSPDFSKLKGIGFSVNESFGVSGMRRLPIGISFMYLYYTKVSDIEYYSTYQEMANEILSGENSDSLNLPAGMLSPMLIPARTAAANQLQWMYTP